MRVGRGQSPGAGKKGLGANGPRGSGIAVRGGGHGTQPPPSLGGCQGWGTGAGDWLQRFPLNDRWLRNGVGKACFVLHIYKKTKNYYYFSRNDSFFFKHDGEAFSALWDSSRPALRSELFTRLLLDEQQKEGSQRGEFQTRSADSQSGTEAGARVSSVYNAEGL